MYINPGLRSVTCSGCFAVVGVTLHHAHGQVQGEDDRLRFSYQVFQGASVAIALQVSACRYNGAPCAAVVVVARATAGHKVGLMLFKLLP